MYAESKKRRPRFSNAELAMLVNEVYGNKEVLFSKKCSTYSNEQKSRAWQAVTDSINTVCVVEPRTTEEVRRKWYYYLSDKKKDFSRQKAQKKTSRAAREILYSPSDLKILEILGEIECSENDEKDMGGGVEGLVCEVDADALPLHLRSPAASSSMNDERISFDDNSSQQQESVNGFSEAVPLEATKTESDQIPYETDLFQSYKTRAARRQRGECGEEGGEENEDEDNMEFLQMEKRRLMVQEYQLQVLQGIHKQMQEDAERNRAFQDAFLDIQRQRLELKKQSMHQRKGK